MNRKLEVIVDDREKLPWTQAHVGLACAMTVKRLDFGDYTIKGLENRFRIERKNSWGELYGNWQKDHNILKTLSKLSAIRCGLLVIEDSFAGMFNVRTPNGLVPRSVVNNIYCRILVEYQVPVIVLDNKIEIVQNIFQTARRLL